MPPKADPNICPKCGGWKNETADQCCDCYVSELKSSRSEERKARMEPCPRCGELKDKRSEVCAACRKYPERVCDKPKGHPRLSEADVPEPPRDWLLQFAGFFVADGCVTNGGGGSPSPCLRVNVRADDSELVEDIVKHLGGSYSVHDPKTGHNSHPQACWAIYGFSRLLPVIEMLLAVAVLPARKFEQLKIAKEWCEWRLGWGNFLGEEGHRITREYSEQLSAAKDFNVRG